MASSVSLFAAIIVTFVSFGSGGVPGRSGEFTEPAARIPAGDARGPPINEEYVDRALTRYETDAGLLQKYFEKIGALPRRISDAIQRRLPPGPPSRSGAPSMYRSPPEEIDRGRWSQDRRRRPPPPPNDYEQQDESDEYAEPKRPRTDMDYRGIQNMPQYRPPSDRVQIPSRLDYDYRQQKQSSGPRLEESPESGSRNPPSEYKYIPRDSDKVQQQSAQRGMANYGNEDNGYGNEPGTNEDASGSNNLERSKRLAFAEFPTLRWQSTNASRNRRETERQRDSVLPHDGNAERSHE